MCFSSRSFREEIVPDPRLKEKERLYLTKVFITLVLFIWSIFYKDLKEVWLDGRMLLHTNISTFLATVQSFKNM
jgi:hypothetical protein